MCVLACKERDIFGFGAALSWVLCVGRQPGAEEKKEEARRGAARAELAGLVCMYVCMYVCVCVRAHASAFELWKEREERSVFYGRRIESLKLALNV